jgi:hypothetical protein
VGYSNPIGKGLTTGRIDQGVDFAGSGPLYAMGPGTIKSVYNSGWPGGVYILLNMDDGKNVFYAENIAPSVKPGQRVKAGQQIGFARGQYPYIEIGWSDAAGSPTAHGHYTEGVPTPEGKDFAALLGTFGLHIPGAAAGSSTAPTDATTLGFNPIGWVTGAASDEFKWFGGLIRGVTGTASTIGDVATGITGLVRGITKITDLFLMLFRPEFWLRVGAFVFGMIALGAGLYFFKQAI